MGTKLNEEFFDVYDVRGIFTGKISPRSEVHKQGLWHKSVHVWIIKDDKILLQKRSISKESYPDKWDISAAGHISAGEQPLDCAVREVKEEVGLSVSSDALRYLFTVRNQVVLNNGTFVDNEINDVFLLDVGDDNSDIVENFIINDEVASLKWISFYDFKALIKEGSDCFVPHKEEYLKFLELDRITSYI